MVNNAFISGHRDRPLSRIRLNDPKMQSMQQSLIRGNLVNTVDALFMITRLQLSMILQCSLVDVDEFFDAIGKAIISRPRNVLECLSEREMLPALSLDEHLLFPASSVVEIAGDSATGKTQLVMSLAVECGMKGFGSIFVDTEGSFSAERILEIASERLSDNDGNAEHISRSVIVRENLDVLSIEEEIIENDVKLLIIDSIIPLLSESDRSGSEFSMIDNRRDNLISEIAWELKRLAGNFNICVVVVNQARIHNGVADESALGLKWSHSVNWKYFLQRETVQLRKSPSHPPLESSFHV